MSRSLGALGAATALTVGAGMTAPSATAADPIPIEATTITSGPLLALLAGLGVTSLPPVPVTTLGIQTLVTLMLNNVAAESPALSNGTNTIVKFGNTAAGLPLIEPNPGTRGLLNLAIGPATTDLVGAYRGEVQGIDANHGGTARWPAGFNAWSAGTGPGLTDLIVPRPCPTANNCRNETWQTVGLIRDLYRPNGGLLTRFSWLSSLLGIDTTVPGSGVIANGTTAPNNGGTSTLRLNTSVLDLAWQYDPLADFPATLNPFSLVNSLMATLPLNALSGISNFNQVFNVFVQATTPVLAGSSLAAATVAPLGTYYTTLQTYGLPIMELLRLPVQLINLATGWQLPTPIANILEPAMKILVNVGYTDVLAPDELGQCAQSCGTADAKTWTQLGYQPYDRALTQGGFVQRFNGSDPDTPYVEGTVNTPPIDTAAYLGGYPQTIPGQSQIPVSFMSKSPLTLQQWAQVPGDLINALVYGVNHAFDPPKPILPADALTPAATAPPVATATVNRSARTATAVTATPSSGGKPRVTAAASSRQRGQR